MAAPGDAGKLLSAFALDPYSDGGLASTPPNHRRKIILAVGLLVFGFVVICIGIGVYFTAAAGGIPLMAIGSLAFIPGSYYSTVAYRAWKGHSGFSFDSIPEV